MAGRDVLLPFPAPFLELEHRAFLDDSVRDTSPAAQDRVNVVLVAAPSTGLDAHATRAFEAVARTEGFIAESYGSVTVYRRDP